MKIGFIGVGNMAGAIINGIIQNQIFKTNDLILYNRTLSKIDCYKEQGCVVAQSEKNVCELADVIFLCVKPQMFKEVLPKIANSISEQKLVVSIAAGVTVQSIQESLNHHNRVIRVMPNTPMLIGKGVCAIAQDKSIADSDYDILFKIFSPIAMTCFVPENKMNEVTAISGSGPAYIYHFIDSMAKYGEKNGIDYETSLQISCATCIGAAQMILETKCAPQKLIDQVTSPGGTTIEAMNHFYEKNIAKIIDEAMVKCAKRGYELSH